MSDNFDPTIPNVYYATDATIQEAHDQATAESELVETSTQHEESQAKSGTVELIIKVDSVAFEALKQAILARDGYVDPSRIQINADGSATYLNQSRSKK